MKTLVISGASGYLGRNLIDYLKNTHPKIEIIALSSKKNEDFWNYKNKISEGMLLNLAFPRKKEIELINNAIEYTSDLYNKCLDLGIKKIINMSTQSVYNIDRKEAATEEDIVRPFSMYGFAKFYIEKYTEEFTKKNSIDYINIRLSSIVGEDFDQRFINKFIKNYIEGKDIHAIEKNEVFSYLYIKDAIKGLSSIMFSDKIRWNDTYNLATDISYKMTDILKSINKNLSNYSQAKINVKNEVKGNEILKSNQVSSEKLYKNTGFKADTGLDDIIINISKSIIDE